MGGTNSGFFGAYFKILREGRKWLKLVEDDVAHNQVVIWKSMRKKVSTEDAVKMGARLMFNQLSMYCRLEQIGHGKPDPIDMDEIRKGGL